MRLSVVTLATADQERATRFYETFLDESPTRDRSGVVYFRLPGSWLALFPRDALARYCGVDAQGQGFAGITLSMNVDSATQVDDLTARAEDAGARVVRAPGTADWGGHIAWIADPDGHLWELVFNPGESRHGET